MAQLTRVTPKRLLISSMIVGLLGTIGLASWHGAAQSGGIPDAGDSTTPVRFRIQKGEEGVYSGQLSATMTAPKQGTITGQWRLKLTTLATDLDDEGYRRIAYLWLVDADEKNPKEVRGHADFGGQLSFAGIKTTDAHWTKWARQMSPISPRAYLPAFPADKFALGQEWESPTPIIDSMVLADMRWKVAAEETVAGRDCLRVDITPVQPLPSKVEERAWHEGGPPPEITLTDFSGHFWVAKDSGWIVKIEQSSRLATRYRNRDSVTTSGAMMHFSMALSSTRRLAPAELADLSKQHALLRNIQGNVWRGVDGAQAALRKIDAFREGHPDSPYMPALNVLEQSARETIARSTPTEISPPDGHHLLGKKSPRFVGKATDGRTMTPKDFLGKPTVLVMMDTEKEFVKQSAQEIEAFKRKWEPEGVRVVGLAMRTGERTHDFKVKHGLTLILLEPETADMSLLFQMYTDLGTVVLDSKGIVRDHKYGFYPNRLDRLLAKILKK